MELVSVIITTHNRVLQLENAVMSVLNQTYPNIEIIIVDDCSIDNTQMLVSNLIEVHKNIKYFRLEKPSGANAARNLGISKSNGIFITGLDDDDLMLENRISNFIKYYDDKYAFLCSQCYHQVELKKIKLKKIRKIITLDDILYYNHVGNQVFSKKINFINAGCFDENIIASQDYDMWIRLLLQNPIALCIKEPTMIIDQITTNVRITTSKNKFKGYFQVYKKYKYLYKASHKKAQLLRLRAVQNKQNSLKTLLTLITINDPKITILSILKYLIKH